MNETGLMEFIEVMKENRCLWDPRDPSYANKTARKASQTALLNVYQKYAPNAKLASVRKKIDYLRSIYLRERRKVEASEFDDGSMSNEAYVPTLWYYSHLNFLSEVYQPCNVPVFPDSFVQTFLEDGEEERQEIHHQPMGDVTDFQAPPLKALKRKQPTTPEKLPNMPETTLKDSWEAFGLSVGGDLRNLDEKQQTVAQKLISEVIYLAKMGRLSEASAVIDTPSCCVSSSPSSRIVSDL